MYEEDADDCLNRIDSKEIQVIEKTTPYELLETVDRIIKKGITHGCFDYAIIKSRSGTNRGTGNCVQLAAFRDSLAELL